MNTKQIEVAYDRIVKASKSNPNIDPLVTYICENCTHRTVTLKLVSGILPLYHNCEKCGELVVNKEHSKTTKNGEKVSQLWYRPALEYVIELSKTNPTRAMYILDGELVNRICTEPIEQHQ